MKTFTYIQRMVTSILEFLNGECKNKFFLKINMPKGSLDISNMFMTKYQIDLPENNGLFEYQIIRPTFSF